MRASDFKGNYRRLSPLQENNLVIMASGFRDKYWMCFRPGGPANPLPVA